MNFKAAASRGRTLWFRARHRHVELGAGVRLAGRLKVTGTGRLTIGDGVVIERATIHVEQGATVHLGAGCYLNNPTIWADRTVNIGARCILSDAYISTSHFHGVDRDRQDVKHGPVSLGENVWLAAGAWIFPGVSIGAHSTIGAATIVSKDVPAGVVVAGPDQRVLRHV